IVDEAQSIGDGPRGVLLFSVVEEALTRGADTQLLLAGPNLDNPGSALRLFGRDAFTIQTEEATVSQNIIFVDCERATSKRAALSFWAEGQKIELGQIECRQALSSNRAKLVNVALRLGSDGQSLIYATGPDDCEKIAQGLSEARDERSSVDLTELSD